MFLLALRFHYFLLSTLSFISLSLRSFRWRIPNTCHPLNWGPHRLPQYSPILHLHTLSNQKGDLRGMAHTTGLLKTTMIAIFKHLFHRPPRPPCTPSQHPTIPRLFNLASHQQQPACILPAQSLRLYLQTVTPCWEVLELHRKRNMFHCTCRIVSLVGSMRQSNTKASDRGGRKVP